MSLRDATNSPDGVPASAPPAVRHGHEKMDSPDADAATALLGSISLL